MAEQNSNVTRRRSWLRLSLRSLLLVIGIFGVFLAIETNRARRQMQAVEVIRALGGRVQYDFDQHDTSRIAGWLTSRIGKDYFSRVVSISLRATAAGDEDLRHVAHLTSLERLELSETGVTDEGMRHLARLRRMRILSLNETAVTDAGLQAIRRPFEVF